METGEKALRAAIGFILGVLLILAIEFCVLWLVSELFNTRMIPRGLGWVVLPILGGITVAKFAITADHSVVLKMVQGRMDQATAAARLLLSFSVVWMISVGIFFWVFNPYGRYWSDDEWLKFFTILTGPIGITVLGSLLYGWATRVDSNYTSAESTGKIKTSDQSTGNTFFPDPSSLQLHERSRGSSKTIQRDD